MKTTTLVATIVAASALVFIQPVFAQVDGGSAREFSADTHESSMVPSFEGPRGDGLFLMPAPQQPVQSEPGSMYVPPPPVGLNEQFEQPSIHPNSPALMPQHSLGIPYGGFHSAGGYRP